MRPMRLPRPPRVSPRALRPLARSLAAAAFCGLHLFAAPAAQAAPRCAPAGTPGIERCIAGLDAQALTRIYQRQQQSNWCWAASVAMLLGRYGLQVEQRSVAARHDPAAGNVTITGASVLDLVSREWQDDFGRRASLSAVPLAPWRRSFGVLAPEVLQDLGEQRPVLVGAGNHLTLLVQVVFERRTDGTPLGPSGVRLVRGVVLDPASESWVRSLRPGEAAPDLLARVEVQRRPDASPLLQAAAAPQGRID